MRPLLVLSALLLVPLAAHAQRPPSPERAAQKEAMHRLSFLLGDWEGTGWYARGDERMPFRGTETVEARLDTLLLLVEGRHYADIPGRPDPMLVHHAFGVFSFDTEAGRYTFRTYLSEGQGGTFEAHLEGDALVWTMQLPQMGHVRYTIRLDEQGRWHEVGERSGDGESWQQFFEMTLNRMADQPSR